jgi:thioredoxin-related protein
MLKFRKITAIAALVILSNSLFAQKAKRKTVPQKKKAEVAATTSIEKVPTNEVEPKNELKWYGFEEGYKKAVKEKKILLVDAYTDWCGWCKVMDRETYTNAEVITALNSNFVCVKFNPEIDKMYQFGDRKMDGRTLLLWLGYGESSGFPTTYFWFNPEKEEKRDNQAGYLPPADFLKLLSSAVKMRN